MSVNIVVPEMGESIVDARVAKWLKNEGDAVSAGEALVELETDKVDVEVSAPKGGVLEKIAHAKGDDVKIGDVLGMIADGQSALTNAAGAPPPAAAAPRLADSLGAAAAGADGRRRCLSPSPTPPYPDVRFGTSTRHSPPDRGHQRLPQRAGVVRPADCPAGRAGIVQPRRECGEHGAAQIHGR